MGSGPSARFGSPPIPGALPTAGLRCGRTVVPGAEVSSISVPPLTKPNLKPPVLLPPSPPPIPLCAVLATFFQLSIQRAESGTWSKPGPGDLGLIPFCLPQALLLLHPLSGFPGPVFTTRPCLPCSGSIVSWLLTLSPPEVRPQEGREPVFFTANSRTLHSARHRAGFNKHGLNH